MSFRVPEKYRVTTGRAASSEANGNNGAFVIPHPNRDSKLKMYVIASDGSGWCHVSVSLGAPRNPTWAEMCFIKAMFWEAEDTVLQFHPPESEYVNDNEHCLHLWQAIGVNVPRPPQWMV